MGQNFLFDKNTINKICQTIKSYFNKNLNLLEIGPGLGSLSLDLKNITNNYKAIEIDKRLFSYLIENKIFNVDNLLCEDALKLSWDNIFNDNKSLLVVGNLPYSISTKLIDKFIHSKKSQIAILMVQKEMADRITAKVNSKDYNYFSVYLQSNLDVKKLFLINPRSFIPRPAVDSNLILLIKNLNKSNLNEEFEKFLKLCFLQRRKTLFNNLKENYNPQKILYELKKMSKSEKTRAQELTWNELLILEKNLNV